MNVTLRQLRVFQSVARTRNFSRTGEIIGLTQPAVSRAIGELEHAMGLRLLDRTTREVALTEAMSLVLPSSMAWAVTVAVTVPPAATVPSEKVTTPPETLNVPWLVVADL